MFACGTFFAPGVCDGALECLCMHACTSGEVTSERSMSAEVSDCGMWRAAECGALRDTGPRDEGLSGE